MLNKDALQFAHFNNSIPFVLPQVVTDAFHMGRGVLRKVTFVANTDTPIVHNLGRIPQFVIVLGDAFNTTNPPAASFYCPKWKRSIVTAWTTATLNIQMDTACTGCWIWII
jgi:hypothetical protein